MMNEQRVLRFNQGGPVMHENHEWTRLASMGVFLIVAIATLYVVFKIALVYAQRKAVTVDPLEVAKQRFANGDITREQYTDIKKELS